MSDRSVIVTGHRGFLGRYVVSRLRDEGWFVCGVGHATAPWPQMAPLRPVQAEVIGDVDMARMQEAVSLCPTPLDAVIHAAGVGAVGLSEADPSGSFDLSVRSTAEVATFLVREAIAARLIYVSSAAVYGQSGTGAPLSERISPRPISLYGSHKLAAENFIQSLSEGYGLSATVVRFFSLYGPGLRKQLIWDLCQQCAAPEGRVVLQGDGSDIRDFIAVGDAADLLARAAATEQRGLRIVNGGTGRGATVREVGERTTASYGVAPPEFSGAIRSFDPTAFVADTAAAEAAFGFTSETSLEQGLQDTVAWHKTLSRGDA